MRLLGVKKTLVWAFLVLMATMAVHAQIPAEVTNVMNKCQAAMSNPNGIEYNMDMKVAMGPVTLTNSHMAIASKGEMSRVEVGMRVVGVEVTMLSGFDGNESWEVISTGKDDTIRITKGSKETKGGEGVDLDLAKGFKKAKMKLIDGYYEIDYSDPIDKKSELKKLSLKVSAKNFYLREMKTSAHGAKVTMTITKIRLGLKDNYFKLDLSKYPNAVVVRE
ncbi:MAG: hypothetical protein J5641_03355 [Bacteroidales bacterium]|nr:hypothetical protein [Bacteroidales bacterium]